MFKMRSQPHLIASARHPASLPQPLPRQLRPQPVSKHNQGLFGGPPQIMVLIFCSKESWNYSLARREVQVYRVINPFMFCFKTSAGDFSRFAPQMLPWAGMGVGELERTSCEAVHISFGSFPRWGSQAFRFLFLPPPPARL